MKEEKFNPIEPSKNSDDWDEWYEESENYFDSIYSSTNEEYEEAYKMVAVGISRDEKVVRNASDNVKEILSPVMQYINREDKNNISIYEGDILFANCILPCGEVYLTYQVLWQDFRYVLRGVNNNNNLELADFCFSECEIIGNIYENSELLEEK